MDVNCLSYFSLILMACLKQTYCSDEIVGPTVGMLKTAYCSCICCEPDEKNCYMHPAIEKGYECTTDDCTEEFCAQWQKAKCTSSCFCSKCKSRLPARSQRCVLYDNIAPGCDCGNLENIKCDDELMEDDELAEVKEQIRKLKDQQQCLVPCLCKKCGNKIPSNLQAKCKQSDHLPDDCTCKNTKCPTDKELEIFDRMQNENMNASDLAKSFLQETKMNAELDAINEKLKPAIESGQMSPITMENFKETKCSLQCMCDKCRWDNPNLESSCQKMLQQRESDCPPCAKEINCPDSDTASMCKLYCFCSKCKKDERMSKSMKDKCGALLLGATEICPCKEDINCEILTQIDNHSKKNAKSSSMTSDDGKPRPGKLKPKSKLWDEL